MKNVIRILTMLSIVLLFAITSSKAQEIVVGVRPAHPAFVRRPFRPSPRHIWVSPEYVPSGGAYVYKPGYWALPPRPGTVWVGGHWVHRHRGYVWVAGGWR
jgi:hypothetical protein